jgi:peroxiredoxin (alkyl hydroperoxide reductase subunit C)
MSALGQVRIGHKAPDFHCEAVMKGVIEGMYVYLSYPKDSGLPIRP